MILNNSINDSENILINLYNANTDEELIDVLSSLFELLEEFNKNMKKHLVIAGDFNLLFDSKLEAGGANSIS